MNAPKKRKLLIQIGIIFALIFIFVTPVIVVISLKKENLGFIYDIGHGQGLLELDTGTMLGEKLWQDDEIPDIMNEYVAGTRSDITFERVEIKKANLYSYVGYKPVSLSGKPRFAVCVFHDWSRYHTSMLASSFIKRFSTFSG